MRVLWLPRVILFSFLLLLSRESLAGIIFSRFMGGDPQPESSVASLLKKLDPDPSQPLGRVSGLLMDLMRETDSILEKKGLISDLVPMVDDWVFNPIYEVRTSTAKARFKRIDYEGLEGWEDEAGTLWLDKIGLNLTYRQGQKYCKKMGARVATIKDFERLRRYMGLGTFAGYKAEILPDRGHRFKSATVTSYNSSCAYVFQGSSGHIVNYHVWNRDSVRCIIGGPAQ